MVQRSREANRAAEQQKWDQTSTGWKRPRLRNISTIRNSVAELEQEQNRLREDITAQRAAIVAHLQAASRLSSDDFVKQLLSQSSNADADRLMRYHGYFSEQRIAEMGHFKANLAELTDTEQRLDLQLKKQTEQAQTLKEQSQALKEQRRDRLSDSALADQRKTKADQQAALVADSERLRKLINELRRQPAPLTAKHLPEPRAYCQDRSKEGFGINLAIRGQARICSGEALISPAPLARR